MDYELIEARTSEDCGCPEEVAVIWPFEVIIHLEEDGSGHLFLDCGEWQDEVEFADVLTIDSLRARAVEHVASIPHE